MHFLPLLRISLLLLPIRKQEHLVVGLIMRSPEVTEHERGVGGTGTYYIVKYSHSSAMSLYLLSHLHPVEATQHPFPSCKVFPNFRFIQKDLASGRNANEAEPLNACSLNKQLPADPEM